MSYNNQGGGNKAATVAAVLAKPNSQSRYTKPGEPVIMVYIQDAAGNLTDMRQYIRIDWEKFTQATGFKLVKEYVENQDMLGKKIGVSQNVRVQQRGNYQQGGQQQYQPQQQAPAPQQQYTPPPQQQAVPPTQPAPQGGTNPSGADVQQPQQAPTAQPDTPF